MTRFEPKHAPLELLDKIKAVSQHADPEDPTQVSTAFDAARQPAGHEDLAAAASIARRLGLRWSEVLSTAWKPASIQSQQLGTSASDRGRKCFTLERVGLAVKHIAASLDTTKINRAIYGRERDRLVERDQRARHHLPRLSLQRRRDRRPDRARARGRQARAQGRPGASPCSTA
jgi:hypothetical protein